MHIGLRIKKLMHAKNITTKAMAAHCGITPGAVSSWFATGRISKERLAMAAELLKVSTDALISGDEYTNVIPAKIGERRIPLISYVQAGVWTDAVDAYALGDGSDWLLTDLDLSGNAFALQIKGDSMLPEFRPGDRIIVDPAIAPHPGDCVVAKNGEEEATFKKYRPRGMDASGNVVFELVPLNDDYPTMRSDVTPIRIVGTMVEHRKYRRKSS